MVLRVYSTSTNRLILWPLLPHSVQNFPPTCPLFSEASRRAQTALTSCGSTRAELPATDYRSSSYTTTPKTNKHGSPWSPTQCSRLLRRDPATNKHGSPWSPTQCSRLLRRDRSRPDRRPEGIMLEQMTIAETGDSVVEPPPPYKKSANEPKVNRRIKPISERTFTMVALIIFAILGFIAVVGIGIAVLVFV
ncbi:hypothetical protein L596_028248 [Steinernema carpocapsae]|uniref:Uncharacterized protein n=1 Tax=Steinernema carpocapsae TaxID=34508 RepID=A0A4U5LXV0_STECR|nr:hypothetical protein L596_028248 [Steinernema carpocapsae]